MKVVHSCTSKSFSGLEGYVLELASWQYAQGKDVELFCRAGGMLEKKARATGLPLWTIPADSRPGPLLWSRLAAEWRAKLAGAVGRKEQALGTVDERIVLHMHAGGEPWFHFPALKASGRAGRLAKSVLHYHIWINHKKTDPFHRMVFSQIGEVWTSSESARAHLATLLPVNRERIKVVPYGRDVQKLKHSPLQEWRAGVRANLGLTTEDVLGVCISRLEPIKGVSELFEAFVSCATKLPHAHLALVGGPSPQNAEAESFASELTERHGRLAPQIRSRLHLMGFVSPSDPVLAAGDFYVLPSYEECMSLAMLDAAILGLPIIGTNTGGTPSVARPDESGALVPPRDVPALTGALQQFYSDAGLRLRLSQGSSALGLQFDRERIFGEIWRQYEG